MGNKTFFHLVVVLGILFDLKKQIVSWSYKNVNLYCHMEKKLIPFSTYLDAKKNLLLFFTPSPLALVNAAVALAKRVPGTVNDATTTLQQ